MRKKRLIHRLGSGVLILSLLTSSGIIPVGTYKDYTIVQAAENVSEDTLKVSDKVEVKVGTTITSMKLYQKGVYETKLDLEAGEHTIQILRNDSTYLEKKTIVLEEAKAVYVRIQNNTIIDSVNNATEFHTAALVGNFTGLSFVNEANEPYTIASWEPADANAELTYVGGGIFTRTFTFEALEADLTIADTGYKVALDDGWSVSFGDGAGNIALTIPAGSTSLTVFVDTLNQKVYDSVRSGEVEITQSAGNVTLKALDMNVSLIGSARQDESTNWVPDATGYEFTRLTDTLYIYQSVYTKGTYEYKTIVDYTNWYEKTAGNKGFTITDDSKNVIFLYDSSDESLYDSINDGSTVAVKLGMEEEVAVSKVQDNANGTTTFITTLANKTDTVKLVYAPFADPTNTTTVTLTTGKDGSGNWNNTFVSDEIFFGDDALDYVYYYEINGTPTLDDSATSVIVGEVEYSHYTRAKFEGRLVTVPGTFPGPSWDAASNAMTYVGNGFYSYTFKNVPAANYEFKIATGTWSENYGVAGIGDGSNYGITVPEKQDVTVYYTDLVTHLAVTSVNYEFLEVGLTGTAIDTQLTDSGLTGIYKATVLLPAGTYSDLVLSFHNKTVPVDEFTITEEKAVTFYFDPSTEIFYNDSNQVEVDATKVIYDSRDTAYKSVYGAVEENENVTFSIATGADATKAMLVVKGKDSKTVAMTSEDTAGGKKWSVDVSFDEYGQYTYFFVLYYGSYVQIYCDDDGYYGTGKLTNISDLKAYDLNVYKQGFKTPDWVKNGVFYQIFPDRFYNGDTTNDKAQIVARGATEYEFVDDWYLYPENPDQKVLNPDSYPENACEGDGIWNNEIYGGDLEGITEKMDYLKAVGVNVIYLNPVFASISSHRYDTADYKKIDPILGDMGDFSELVRVAEENGMKIVLDGVFNHVSDDSIYFDRYYKFVGQDGKVGAYPYWAYVYDYMSEHADATKAEAEAKAKVYFRGKGVTDFSYTEWFELYTTYITDADGNPVCDTIGDRVGKPVYGYDCWWGYDNMPVVLSTNGSEYQTGNWADEIMNDSDSVTKYWINKGSNGWRLDVANEVSDETWQHFRNSVKSLNSNAVIIGEIWDDATEYILGDMYDSVMNYVFRSAVLSYAKGGSASDSVKELEKIRERYPEEAFYAMMNLVGSHDTSRVLSYLDGIDDDRKQTDINSAFPTYETTSNAAKQRQYIVALIQMTYPGAPTIYYGDEIGMVGADDPDDRRGMAWGEGNQELVEWYAKLAEIRSEYAALRTGSISPVDLENDALMAYVRSDKDDSLFVITNNTGRDITVTCDVPTGFIVNGSAITDLVQGAECTVADGKLTVTVPAYRGVVLTENVKVITVDYEALKPAYDSAYQVAVKESETTVTTAPPTVTASPSPTPEVTVSPSPSVKPVKKTQKITVDKTTYKKALGSKAFSINAKTTGDGKLSYASTNKKVATVSSKGKVTIRGTGVTTITITASATDNYKKAVKKVKLIVTPKRIGCTVNKKVVTTKKGNKTTKKYYVKVNWKKNTGATGYEITFATDKNFTKNKYVRTVSNKTTACTLSGAKANKTYYVRIRSYKTVDGKKYYSGYSDTRKVTMK